MRLTLDYRPITSVFNSPVDFTEGGEEEFFADRVYTFSTGIFEYSVAFIKRFRDNYLVSFRLARIKGTRRDRVEFWSKFYETPVSGNEADYFSTLEGMPSSVRFGIPRTGFGYQVLSSVSKIIEDFVTKYKPDCIKFSSNDSSRTNIYKKIIERLNQKYDIESDSSQGATVDFTVCFDNTGTS